MMLIFMLDKISSRTREAFFLSSFSVQPGFLAVLVTVIRSTWVPVLIYSSCFSFLF
jgi:hypothetical protein